MRIVFYVLCNFIVKIYQVVPGHCVSYIYLLQHHPSTFSAASSETFPLQQSLFCWHLRGPYGGLN